MRHLVLSALAAGMVAVGAAGAMGCGTEAPVPPPALDCGLAPPIFDIRGDVVQGESDAGCIRVERRTIALEEDFICKACPYEATAVIARVGDHDEDNEGGVALDFELRDDLASDDRDDVGALTYEASHHNWADAVFVHGDGRSAPTSLSLRIRYDVPNDGWDLEVLDGDDAVLTLPIVGSRL